MKRTRKWNITAWGLLIVCVLGIIFLALSFFNYNKIIQKKLPEWCNNATDSLYNIRAGDIKLSILTNTTTISNVELWPDSLQVERHRAAHTMPKQLFEVNIPEIRLSGVVWFSLLFRKSLSCNKLVWTDPSITLRDVSDTLQSMTSNDTMRHKIGISSLQIVNPKFLYISKSDTVSIRMPAGECTLDNLFYAPPGTRSRDQGMLSLAELESDSIYVARKQGIHSFCTGKVSFSRSDSTLNIRGMSLKPRYTREDLAEKLGHQQPRYDLEFPDITIVDMDWNSLFEEQKIHARNLRFTDPEFNIELNRIPPPSSESKMGRFPVQVLHSCPVPLHIDSITLVNADVRYTEVSDMTYRPSDVFFTGISGTISNINNRVTPSDSNVLCVAVLHGRAFDLTGIDAVFEFPLDTNNGAFHLNATFHAMDVTKLNPTARNSALVHFESLNIQRFNIEISGDEMMARGNFVLTYKDLKLSALKMKEGNIVDDKVKTFLLRNLLLYPDNPMKGEDARTVHGIAERDPYKSFFNLVWKCTMIGALKTALRSDGYADKVLDKQIAHDNARRAASR